MAGIQVLQNVVSPIDLEWVYPHAKQLALPKLKKNDSFYLRHVNFSSSKISLSEGWQKTNRILCADNNPTRNIITVSFEKLRFKDNYSAGPEYISRVLKKGVVLNGITFKFYGHSNSQLKSRTCYMYAETNVQKIWNNINSFGDFGGIMSVSKRAKRIGLLFSAAEMGLNVDQKCTLDIPDIEEHGQVFTDGCGFISKSFASILAKKKKIIFRDQKYVPSVFQIRYKGYKGTVFVNPDLDNQSKLDKTPISSSIHFHFRDSMKKFKNCPDNTFAVLEYSKPYQFAKLNGELVSLLSCLGIPDEIFIKKLDWYLNFINNSIANEFNAFLYLCSHDEYKLAEQVVLDGLKKDKNILSKIKSLRATDLKRFYKNPKFETEVNAEPENLERVHILIPSSRLLFGICDCSGKLKENEVFVRITMEGQGVKSLVGAEVIVGRNPCLHPGDIQKFKVVHIDELAHLVDCIVFSTKGHRPSPSLLSGGDLDGDKFFVCWDSDLIPSKLYEPYGYPPAKESTRNKVEYEDMINYFAKYNNASLGKTKDLYLRWMKVTKDGAGSKECQELNALFSSCVDGQPIKIPDHLKTPPEQDKSKKFILDKLCDKVKKEVTSRVQTDDGNLIDSLPIEIINVLISAHEICLNEFELFQLINRWCVKKKEKVTQFLSYFDFGAFTSLQKHWIIQQIPIDDRKEWMGPIFNDLYSSQVITKFDLERHHLDSEMVRWKQIYSTNTDNTNLKLMLRTSLELFHRKFLIVKVHSRFAYGIYFSKPIEKTLVDLTGTCKLFAFTSVSDSITSTKYISEKDYKLFFDGEVFQLYQHNKTNSFIYFRFADHVKKQEMRSNNERGRGYGRNSNNRGRGQVDRNYQGHSQRNDDGLQMITSVALDKFSAGIKTHVGRLYRESIEIVEIYVISNRDRIGHQILDLMHTVETVEIVPIIQNIPNEYEIPTLADIPWDTIPITICEIITKLSSANTNISHLTLRLSFSEIKSLCQTCVNYDLISHLVAVVENYLDHLNHFKNIDGYSQDFLQDLLSQAPYLSTYICQEINLKDSEINTCSLRLCLCKALIKCANEYREMSLNLFGKLVTKMILHNQVFDPSTCIEIVKLIIFSIRDSDLAQEFLNEIFDSADNCGQSLVQVDDDDVEAEKYFVKFIRSSAMNYISEVKEKCPCSADGRFIGQAQQYGDDDRGHGHGPKPTMTCLVVKFNEKENIFETMLRIDIHHSIRNGDHLRLRASSKPKTTTGVQINRQTIVDIIVQSIYNGCMKFKIQQKTPIEIEKASWDLFECGNPTTLITTFEAVETLVLQKLESTWSYRHIVNHHYEARRWDRISDDEMDAFLLNRNMNQSQMDATKLTMNNVMTVIWGPPGTGKTSTVISIVMMCLHFYPGKKILVSASTHNATDNILERLISDLEKTQDFVPTDIVRVTSEVSKVKKNLQKWTLDAFVGGDLHENQKLKKEALKRVQKARIVASTCSGAGVGILRNEQLQFHIVIVDEASQLTEPNALIPIVKGSQKIVLVGDHVQLRSSISELGKAYSLDISLFERLSEENCHVKSSSSKIAKPMLQVQYRMHPLLVKFPNDQFYSGQLKSGVIETERCLPPSEFPWPKVEIGSGDSTSSFKYPVIFVQCDCPESRGTSKSNIGQAKVVAEIVRRLRTVPQDPSSNSKSFIPQLTITILTPYARQVKVLSDEVKKCADVFTIDSYQGREADLIIFSTTRCNNYGSIGFLEDERRTNVMLTRAKFGLIVVGDKNTLKSNKMWSSWLQQCRQVDITLPKH